MNLREQKERVMDDKIKTDIQEGYETTIEDIRSFFKKLKSEPFYISNDIIYDIMSEELSEEDCKEIGRGLLEKTTNERYRKERLLDKMTEEEEKSFKKVHGDNWDEIDIPAYIRRR